MKAKLLVISLAALLAPQAHAQTYDMRDFFDSIVGSYPAQTPGSLWTFHFGSQEGSLLPVLAGDAYGYGCGSYCTQIGQKVNAGDAYWNGSFGYGAQVTPTFNGVFLHPGYDAATSTAVVFNAPADIWLDGVTIQAEMISNGLAGDGVDIAVRHTRNGVSTVLGTYSVSGADYSEQSFSFGSTPLLFTLGDQIEIDVGPNPGSYWYDHLNINVLTTAVAAPVPEPEAYVLFLAGLGLVGLMTHRRVRES
jgi:hypothetical protein